MSIKKIGFDFDKIFVNYPPFIPDFIINYFYKKHNHNLKYRFPGRLERGIRIISHASFFRPPIWANINSLKRIAEKNNIATYLVSSRFSFLKNQTKVWDNKNDIFKYFKKVFFNFSDTQPHLFKDRIVKKEKIDKFIDDDFDLLKYLAINNSNVEFYWLTSKKSEMKLPHNIKPIANIEEFRQKYL